MVVDGFVLVDVVPHAGTWIEMFTFAIIPLMFARRSPRGNVD